MFMSNNYIKKIAVGLLVKLKYVHTLYGMLKNTGYNKYFTLFKDLTCLYISLINRGHSITFILNVCGRYINFKYFVN